MNKEKLIDLISKTANCFRLGKDGEGNLYLSKIFDYFINEIEINNKVLSAKDMERLGEIKSELDKRNYNRIADILEYELNIK